jgi:TPR repeat protein
MFTMTYTSMTRGLIAALALILPLCAYAGFDEAVAAYSVGDYATAMTEFKALAEQGDVKSQYFVGFLYHRGFGTEVNNTEAAKWFTKAASQGDATSMYYLGKMAEKGEGMPKDLAVAHMWLELSAAHSANVRDAGYTREDLQKLERKMNAEQIAQAKEMAKGWKPTP